MTPISSNAEVRANVDVRPHRSQVFLVAMVILAAVAMVLGAILLSSDKNIGLVFLLASVVIVAWCFKAWNKSQSDVDLDKAHPTQVVLPDGTKVDTDSRLLKSKEGVAGLLEMLSGVLHRVPLPPAEGIINQDGDIVPDSTEAAAKLTKQINDATQSMTNDLIDEFRLGDKIQIKTNYMVAPKADNTPTEPLPQGLNVVAQSSARPA